MGLVRVLVAWLPESHQQLGRILADAENITLVGAATDPVGLLLACGRSRADAVVLGMDGEALPGVATHLLAEYPHVKVLGVTQVTGRVLLYELRPWLAPLGELPLQAFPEAIRAAVCSEVPE